MSPNHFLLNRRHTCVVNAASQNGPEFFQWSNSQLACDLDYDLASCSPCP